MLQIKKLKKEVRKKILRQAYGLWGQQNGAKQELFQSLQVMNFDIFVIILPHNHIFSLQVRPFTNYFFCSQPYLQNKMHKSGPAVRRSKKIRDESDPELQHLIEVLAEVCAMRSLRAFGLTMLMKQPNSNEEDEDGVNQVLESCRERFR